jgi:hypothetical protein
MNNATTKDKALVALLIIGCVVVGNLVTDVVKDGFKGFKQKVKTVWKDSQKD